MQSGKPPGAAGPGRPVPWILGLGLAGAVLFTACQQTVSHPPARSRVEFARDDARGRLEVRIGGRPAFTCVYSEDWDLPHLYPIFSPSGQPMTVQKAEPYPHHRSFWFADTVQRAGHREASFYNAWYSGAGGPKDPHPPFRDRIRHDRFLLVQPGSGAGRLRWRLIWEMDHGQTPVLEETRDMRVVALEDGQYFLDVTFTVTAAFGPVTFRSDAVHYAWPYVRMNNRFNTNGQGRLVNSEGGIGQAGTHDRPARWVDFSRTGVPDAEGLALFSHPSNPHPHTWLTRDYGTFGPRREAARNGRPFTLPQGASLSTRVGVLVHRGDAQTGRVDDWYRAWCEGRL